MKTVHIPQIGCAVSTIGLGTAALSGAAAGTAFAILDTYRRLAGNLIDTAKMYHQGESEAVIGEWLATRGLRDAVIVMDKACGEENSLTPDGIRAAIGGCLQRLRTDHLDIFTIHRDHPDVGVELVVDVLSEEIAAGRIRSYGLSNWPVPRLAAAIDYARTHGLQGPAVSSIHVSLAIPVQPLWPYCLHASEEDLAWHAEAGLPLLAWSPLGHGFLSDHPWPSEESEDIVARSYHNDENLERLFRARHLAQEKGFTIAQIALAYVVNLQAPIVAVVGALTPDEVESAFAAADIALSHEETSWLSLKTPSR